MTVKKIDTKDIAEMVDKSHLFAEKVEYLFHRVYGCEENDKIVCLALDVIGHFQREINDIWEKIRTAPETEKETMEI